MPRWPSTDSTGGQRTRTRTGDAWQRNLGRFRAALEAHWKPYLEGRAKFDEALVTLLADAQQQHAMSTTPRVD